MQDLLMFRDPEYFLVQIIVIVLSISLHEFGHAISADMLGDDTPRSQGRVTLWPDKHFDPMGFIMMFLTINFGRGLGWGRPVQVNFARMRHPRRDMLLVAAAGPLMNLILAVTAGMIIRYSLSSGHDLWLDREMNGSYATVSGSFVFSFLTLNLSLMFFNLIPIHPLDGSKILSSLLPLDLAITFDRFIGQWGPFLILSLCFLSPGTLSSIIGPAVQQSITLLTGQM